MLTFSVQPQYCQTISMCGGIGRVYKHSKCNWPHPSPNKTFVLPSRSMYSSKNDSTRNFGASMIGLIRNSPVPNLTITNKVDADINNDDDSRYFSTTSKHYHSATEFHATNSTTTQV